MRLKRRIYFRGRTFPFDKMPPTIEPHETKMGTKEDAVAANDFTGHSLFQNSGVIRSEWKCDPGRQTSFQLKAKCRFKKNGKVCKNVIFELLLSVCHLEGVGGEFSSCLWMLWFGFSMTRSIASNTAASTITQGDPTS